MIDSLELLDEYRLGVGDVTEGDGTFLEIALSHLSVDEAVDEFADGLLGVVGKGSGGGFDGVGLEGWRRSKNAEFIGGIVYQSWEQFEPLEKHFVEDIPETPDLEHPYPTIFMRDGNLLFGTQATFTDPSTGEKYKGYITYEWDFENDVRTGYSIKRADEYVNKYF